jgi:hypothetical protein
MQEEEIAFLSDFHLDFIREWISTEDSMAQAASDRFLAWKLRQPRGLLATPEEVAAHLNEVTHSKINFRAYFAYYASSQH